MFKLILFCLIVLHFQGNFASTCVRKVAKYGILCVCNATYCDTIEPIGEIPEGKYVEYTTTKRGKRFEKIVRSFWNVTSDHAIKVMVDPGNTFQTMFGIGGALPDATLINIYKFPQYMQQKILKSIFSDDGLEFDFLRIPIAGTDMSDHPYTYDDGPPDPELKNFNLTKEDYQYRIPILQAARKYQPRMKLSACPWSSPPWMKTNNNYCRGRLLQKYYQTFVDYLIKYLDFYRHYGIDMWSLSTVNEPITAGTPFNNMNSILMSYERTGDFIANYLGPSLRRSAYSNVKLLGFEDFRLFAPWWIDKFSENNTAMDYVDGFAVHSYGDKVSVSESLTQLQMKYPDKFLLATEVGELNVLESKVFKLGDWRSAAAFVRISIENINNWVAGILDWNLMGDLKGGPSWNYNSVNSPLIANPAENEFYKQPVYYAIGHLSKFVREGDVKIFHSMPKVEKLSVVGFKRIKDNRITLVFLNEYYDKRYISIQRDQDNSYLNIILDPFSIKTIIYYP